MQEHDKMMITQGIATRRRTPQRLEQDAKDAGGLVFLGAIAALYVLARITLTYGALAH